MSFPTPPSLLRIRVKFMRLNIFLGNITNTLSIFKNTRTHPYLRSTFSGNRIRASITLFGMKLTHFSRRTNNTLAVKQIENGDLLFCLPLEIMACASGANCTQLMRWCHNLACTEPLGNGVTELIAASRLHLSSN